MLDLSEEYNINNLKISIEKHLVKTVQYLSTSRSYGKTIKDQLDYLVYLLNLSTIYRLNKLKAECMSYIAKKFDKTQIDNHVEFNKVEADVKLVIFRERSAILEEQIKLKETKFKQMQDEILKQKFEINRLKNLLEK